MSEKILLSIPDVSVNIAGTKHQHLWLPFDSEPSRDEILSELERVLSFPPFTNDNERENYLSIYAFAAHPKVDLLGEYKLQLLGDAALQEVARGLLQHFVIQNVGEEGIVQRVGEKLLATLRDGERHSFSEGVAGADYQWLTTVQTHLGKYKDVAPKLKNGHYSELVSLIESGRSFADFNDAVLALDYFIVDADIDTNTPFHLSLAVSFLPLTDKIPPEYQCFVFHTEMLSEKELKAITG